MQQGREWAERVRREIQKAVVGQDALVERLLVALLADGHVLLEGMPGLGKTLLVRSLGSALGLDCKRIQFTPDLLPADVVGTMVFEARSGRFDTHRGPIFANLVLADEINRAPAKVQSALLEAMQERQVTIGGHTHALPRPFLVMATQNPIEQEGTYPLPEAQTDRFLFKLIAHYPSEREERDMLARWGELTTRPELRAVSSGEEILELRRRVDAVHVGEELRSYALALVRATREVADGRAGALGAANGALRFGASPRASLALYQASRALACLRGMDYVTPALVQELFPDVARHRVALRYEAEAEERSSDAVLEAVARATAVPAAA
jgi:MoxR-like ATPase